MADPQPRNTFLIDCKNSKDQEDCTILRFPSQVTQKPTTAARIGQRYPEVSVLECETYRNPSMIGAIKQKNSLGHQSFDYEVKTTTGANAVDGPIEVIDSPEILPKNWNDMTEQERADIKHGGELSGQDSQADSDSNYFGPNPY